MALHFSFAFPPEREGSLVSVSRASLEVVNVTVSGTLSLSGPNAAASLEALRGAPRSFWPAAQNFRQHADSARIEGQLVFVVGTPSRCGARA